MTKALVTGGAGYLGDLLARKLNQLGYGVRIFDISVPDDPCSGIEFVQGDIRDIAAIDAACKGIELVFHNVAQVPLAKDKKLFWSVNRDGTHNMLEASVARGVRKVIYTSSSAVYGVPTANPVTESAVPNPREDYGRAKLAGENLCWEYGRRGLDVSVVRPRTIMGPGRLGIFQILFEWIYQGTNIPVLNDGRNRYQFVHADDLVNALVLAASEKGPQAYNCGTSSFGTMREVLEHLCNHAGTGSVVKSLPMWMIVPAMNVGSYLGISPLGAYHSLMYGRSMYFDISKAEAELGWRPKYSNNAMFIDSYDWYVNHRAGVLQGSDIASRHRSAVKQGVLSMLRWLL
jgi:nucleoside-diphosphate-sugar epimerase